MYEKRLAYYLCYTRMDFPGGSVVKNLPANAGDASSIPELERSPAEGNGNPFQCSCLENFMDRGAWRATDHGVARTRARTHTHTHTHTHGHVFALTAFHTFKTVIPALLQ